MIDNDWQWLTTIDNDWQRLTTIDYNWQRLTTIDYNWLRLTTIDVFFTWEPYSHITFIDKKQLPRMETGSVPQVQTNDHELQTIRHANYQPMNHTCTDCQRQCDNGFKQKRVFIHCTDKWSQVGKYYQQHKDFKQTADIIYKVIKNLQSSRTTISFNEPSTTEASTDTNSILPIT